MTKRVFLTLLLAFILALPPTLAQNGMPALADLEVDTWTVITPEGDTICSNGTPYQFYVRPADPEKLLVYFNGGGACWFTLICDLTANPTYFPFADMPQNSPEDGSGIFDLANEENPFADYTMVFVPYCTADVHIGGGETVYEVPAAGDNPAREVPIQHNGWTNGMTVMNWVFENIEALDQIFVAGSSAGAIPSPLYTAVIADNYPDAAIAQLGDGAGGYRSNRSSAVFSAWNTLDILPEWPEFEGETVDTLKFEDFYVVAAKRHPDILFTQYNTAEDEVQYSFLTLLGELGISLPEKLEANFADINAEVDNFRVFTAGGPLHTILRAPQFYTYAANGIRVRDWVAALAAGEAVEDVRCEVCDVPEEIGGDS